MGDAARPRRPRRQVHAHGSPRCRRCSTPEPGEDSLEIKIVRQVDIDVPSVAKKFIKPANTVTSTDRWERQADGSCGGHSDVDIKGVPVQSIGSASLVDDGAGGCDYTITLTLKVKVPMIGEKVAGCPPPAARGSDPLRVRGQ